MMGLIGACLLAVPVILTMQFLATSTRPSFGFGVAAMGSLPPESLATILFGNVFGSLRATYDYWGPDWHSLAEGTWTDRATNYLFVGTIPALLLLWHGIAGGRLLAREFRFFSIVGVVAILYALGRYTPGFELIFDHLPGVDLYRRPADATFLINIVLAFAAGYLVHRYVRDGLPRFDAAAMGRFRVALPMLAVGLVIAAIASAMVFALRAGQSAASMREIGVALLAATAFDSRLQPRRRDAAPAAGRGTRDDRAHGRRIGRPPCCLAAERGAGGALCGVPATSRRAIAGAADSQARTRRAECRRRSSARGNSRPRRPVAERLHGAADRGHHRLQSVEAGGLRAGHRTRRECRRPEPANLPGDIPRLQVPARRTARPRIPGSRPPYRADAAPLPPPERRRSGLRHRTRCGFIASTSRAPARIWRTT